VFSDHRPLTTFHAIGGRAAHGCLVSYCALRDLRLSVSEDVQHSSVLLDVLLQAGGLSQTPRARPGALLHRLWRALSCAHA
jgi:hypothetical protein